MRQRVLRDRLGAAVLLGLLLFVPAFWFLVYRRRRLGLQRVSGETCILRLRSDHTFQQETMESTQTQKSEGHWYRYGEAHVSFSRSFRHRRARNWNSAGEAPGQFEKIPIFPTLVLAPIPRGPKIPPGAFSFRQVVLSIRITRYNARLWHKRFSR